MILRWSLFLLIKIAVPMAYQLGHNFNV